MKRRCFLNSSIGLIAAATLSNHAHASDVGQSASPRLFDAVRSLFSISEGFGRNSIYVLYTPWCHLSPKFYDQTRNFLSDVRFNWVPHSGGMIEGKIGTENLLSNGTVNGIRNSFIPIGSQVTPTSTPLADQQDMKMNAVASIFISDFGKSLVTPTLVFDRGGNRIRVVRGAPDISYLSRIVSQIK